MPNEKKKAQKTTKQAGSDSTPKQRHRRTMAELLKDPKYRAAKGLDPVDDTEVVQKPETAVEEPEKELPPAVEASEKEFARKTSYSMSRPSPVCSFKRMYPSDWCFEIWNPSTEECEASYRLPSNIVDEDDACDYVKKYCNRHMTEVANKNLVIFEVHKEFLVAVSQIEITE